MTRQSKFLKVNCLSIASVLLLCTSPLSANEMAPLGTFAKAGFISMKSSGFTLQQGSNSGAAGASLTGKSMGSINTIGFAQGDEFIQSVSRRQNKIHSFSNSLGTSAAFFGEEENAAQNGTTGGIMDFLLRQMNISADEAEALPQLWTSTTKKKGKVEGAMRFDTYEYDTNGFSGGVDIKADKSLSLGLAIGYTHSSSTFESLGETSTVVDGYHAALYTTYEREKATIDSALSFTLFQNGSERSLLSAENTEKADAKATGYQIAWSLSAMGHSSENGFSITPLAGFTFAALHNAGMNEAGAGDLNLSAEKTDNFSLRPMLGLDIAKTYLVDGGVQLTPEIYGLYRYEMLGSEEKSNTRLASFDEVSFSNNPTELSRHSLQFGMSVTAAMGENFKSKLQFDSDLKPSSEEHKAMFKLNYVW